LDGEQFVRYLRGLRVTPNGHPRAVGRPLSDKGIRFIVETCRALFGYAAKRSLRLFVFRVPEETRGFVADRVFPIIGTVRGT
jgi:hypothetical protein